MSEIKKGKEKIARDRVSRLTLSLSSSTSSRAIERNEMLLKMESEMKVL
jgi:hypothetical protein